MNKTTTGTILIVDDDPDFLLQQKMLLEATGYTVIEASSRGEAETLLETEQPDAAIVDLMMEESDDGFTLCYRAKKRYPNMPVIMVTGVVSETGMAFGAETSEEQNWVKADALLAKPVRPEQILNELERLLNK